MGALKTIINAIGVAKNTSAADILRNSPLPQLENMNDSQWVSWNQMAQLLNWLDTSDWAPLDWPLIGDLSYQPKNFSVGAAVCRLTLNVRSAYWIGAKWFGSSQFRVVTCEFSDIGPNQIREVLEIPSNLDVCPQLFSMFIGSLAALPNCMFGQPNATVKATIEGRKATYDITYNDKISFWGKLANACRSILKLKQIFLELDKQQTAINNQAVQLLKERDGLGALIESFPDGIIIHHRGTIVFINKCMKTFLKHSGGDLVGTQLIDLVGSLHVENVNQRLENFNENSSIRNLPMEISFRMFGTDDLFYSECTSMQFNFNGKPSVAVVVRDLSDRKQYEKHLLETDRLTSLGLLAAGVGHEINNPLCSIMLKLEIIGQSLRGNVDPIVAKNLVGVDEGLTRIQTIVRDLKNLSRQGDKETIENVDIAKSLTAAISIAKNEIHHRAELELDILSLQPVKADGPRLCQLFLNLIINSAQAIESGNAAGNKICIKAYNDRDNVLVEITDTGRGIPAVIMQNMFKPFFTTKPIGQGTGLGLSICQSIVSRYGGRISFVSEMGVGTTFKVAFPAAVESLSKNAEPENASIKPVVTDKKRVLIIDDDGFLLEALTAVISTKYITTSKLEATEALDLIIAGNEFDVIICDLMMPNMDGIEFYNRLKMVKSHLCENVMFLTGGSFTDRADEFLSQPGIKFSQKPIRSRELLGIIEGIVTAS